MTEPEIEYRPIHRVVGCVSVNGGSPEYCDRCDRETCALKQAPQEAERA